MTGDAASDIRYLLDRGYPQKGAVSFVCNHYRLGRESRHLLSRAVISKAVSEKRKKKFLQCEKIKGNNIVIDGYNIIIGMESILEKKAFICDDGVVRDVKGVFRNFKTSENTGNAIGVILQFLEEKSPSHICFLLDSQVSESGLLARTLREKMAACGLEGDAMTSKHVDYDLKHSDDIVASSDGAIIDAAGKVINFLYCIISGFLHLEAGVGNINEFREEGE